VFDTTTVVGTFRAAKLIEGLATTATGVETGVVTDAAKVAVVMRILLLMTVRNLRTAFGLFRCPQPLLSALTI
jgi:hypothetical protein